MNPLEELLSASADGMFALDAEYRYLVWNAAMERISGMRVADVLGRRVFDVFPFLAATGQDAHLARVLAGETAIVTDAVYSIDETGRRGTYDAKYSPLRDKAGAVVGILGVVRDTTDAKRAEAQIRETESRFRNVANIAPVLLWMSGTDALCTFFNQTWLDFTGRTLAQEWGVGWAEGVHYEDFQHCVDTYQEAFNARRVFEMEYRLRRHDGCFRWILDRGTPRYLPDGTFAGYIGSCIDITDRRELEERLRQAVATRDEFLSVASHELRTPLSSLRLQADGMLRLFGKGHAPSADRAMRAWRTVQGGIERLDQLVTNLLDVSKMGAPGGPQLELEKVNLAQVVRDVCERVREQGEAVGSSLVVEVPERIEGRWDRMRLDQIATNLITNAIKYGRGKPIQVSVAEDALAARIEVRDHGIGIAAQDHARIFGRFERAAPSTSYGGLGLGLWITKQIVEAFGGDITVASELGAGAVFRVRLPRSAP